MDILCFFEEKTIICLFGTILTLSLFAGAIYRKKNNPTASISTYSQIIFIYY